jgi:phosphoribosyl-AMP cyclohydrolase
MDFARALWLSCNKRPFSGQNLRPACKRIAPISDTSDTATAAREQGKDFTPKFDSAGLLTAIAQDSASGEVLMVAFMDREALEATRRTQLAHFHSRSRGRLWMKGESSGHVLHVEAILVDCDQDALVLKVRPAGPACHTGARSCFYRVVDGDGLTRFVG